MGHQDWQFEVELPFEIEGCWWFSIHGQKSWRWGPFPDKTAAHHAELKVFQRWNTAARARGGWAWKATPKRWVVTAPEGVQVEGQPMDRAACTKHHASG